MKHLSLSALVVVALVMFDAMLTMAYAESKVTIFRVVKVASADTLKMRAWPSSTSRIKVSLPHNAVDLTETGKQRVVEGANWVEVNWLQNKGWVNGSYLEKTGVLLHANKIASRNPKATVAASPSISKVISSSPPVKTLNDRPQELAGDRYDQPDQEQSEEIAAKKVSYSESIKRNNKQEILSCNGQKPNHWNMKLDTINKNIQMKFPQRAAYNLPIRYHHKSADKQRVNIGGTKGRNIIDLNLKITNVCYNGISQSALPYEINATIDGQNYSGCCQTVTY